MRKKKLRKITVAIDALLIDASIRQYDLRRDMCNMITRNLRDIDRYALSADCDKALGYNEAQLENFLMSANRDGSRIVISSVDNEDETFSIAADNFKEEVLDILRDEDCPFSRICKKFYNIYKLYLSKRNVKAGDIEVHISTQTREAD